MEARLNISYKDSARAVALVRDAVSRDPDAIRKAFGGELFGGIGFKATVLGIMYWVSVRDDMEVFFTDPLRRKVDAQKLITYMLNALERVLAGKVSNHRGTLVGIRQLKGGSSAHLYEKRIASYLAAEMDRSSIKEVEGAVRTLGGCMVDHPTATWSFEVNPLNGLRIIVAFWQGEEGVPSGASILFDEEVMEVDISIEEIITITEMTIDRLVAFYRKESGREARLFRSLYL
ncbi:MAG: DUF3786 domain-containing protein [Candidatus Bathyarchaeia archaeon]